MSHCLMTITRQRVTTGHFSKSARVQLKQLSSVLKSLPHLQGKDSVRNESGAEPEYMACWLAPDL